MPVMDTARTQFVGVARTLAQTRYMIEESRRVLDDFYSHRDGPIVEPSTMVCLLCDHEAREMNRLKFRAYNRNGDYPSAALSLMLRKFGICDACARPYRRPSRGVLAVLNCLIAEARAA